MSLFPVGNFCASVGPKVFHWPVPFRLNKENSSFREILGKNYLANNKSLGKYVYIFAQQNICSLREFPSPSPLSYKLRTNKLLWCSRYQSLSFLKFCEALQFHLQLRLLFHLLKLLLIINNKLINYIGVGSPAIKMIKESLSGGYSFSN